MLNQSLTRPRRILPKHGRRSSNMGEIPDFENHSIQNPLETFENGKICGRNMPVFQYIYIFGWSVFRVVKGNLIIDDTTAFARSKFHLEVN